MKKIKMVVGIIMAATLVVTACTSPASETKVTSDAPVTTTTPQNQPVPKTTPVAVAPKYGGTLRLMLAGDINSFDLFSPSYTTGRTFQMTNEALWQGDWTKGPAGGYGTGETDWGLSEDVLSRKRGNTVESWKWSADFEKNEGTIVYQLRQGIHFGLNPRSDASKLVNGREVTADDVVHTLKLLTTDNRTYCYASTPELRSAVITKTGPREVTVKTTTDALMTGLSRLGYWGRVEPPEVLAKYGTMQDWANSVGTGPFMLMDYVRGSAATLDRNPAYWDKDPLGPGKGNQLPYVEHVKYLVIPDLSTQLAALRTGKIDQMRNINWEDAGAMQKSTPALRVFQEPMFGAMEIHMRQDKPPFSDVRVRRALMMATDLDAIRKSVNGGLGEIHTWPWPPSKAYADVYVPLDDPSIPNSVRELYVYSPDKAKGLLRDAGYPTGFKTTALVTSEEVDYYSILMDMWRKVGVDLELMIREGAVKNSLLGSKQHPAISSSGVSQAVMYFSGPNFTGSGLGNIGMINDPKVNETMQRIRKTMITDEKAAMHIWREFMPYFLDQAFVIPRPLAPVYNFWWPWIKNYSGEIQIGYGLASFDTWTRWVWIDEALKREMGY